MPHLRAFFCRECREYALFGVEFYTEFWQKFSEILRILGEILTKKMAAGASARDILMSKARKMTILTITMFNENVHTGCLFLTGTP